MDLAKREDLSSILPFLSIIIDVSSSSLCWPPSVVETLEAISKGSDHSNVNSGEALFGTISDLRNSLSLSNSSSLSRSASQGYSLFFDNELISALLACSFFCLFPNTDRSAKNLRAINFDQLFTGLYEKRNEKQEHKIKCIVHYFERICSRMPIGNVSFERKVLPLEHSPFCISYPNANFWSKSTVSLCRLEVHTSGLIEDQPSEALEVDFANKRIGGGALNRGCVQEEIRFMINPELIAGIVFLPAMEDNEAIEIVGAERFSNYTGCVLLVD